MVVRVHPAFTVTALGTRVRVQIAAGALTDDQFAQLRAMWAGCGSETDSAELPDVTVRRTQTNPAAAPPAAIEPRDEGGAAWPSSGSFRSLADHLASDITAAAITHAQGRLLMLHAAALADPVTGRALLFVGRSGAGKTTISRTLGRRLRYLSDETAGIAADGRIEPYPKPLSVRVSDDERPKRQIPPAELGLLPVDGLDARLHRVVVLERSADAPDQPRVEPLTVTQAIAAVTSEVSYLNALDAPLQRLAVACASGGGPVLVRYREAPDLEAVLPELLADASEGLMWSPVETPHATDAAATDTAAMDAAGPLVRRTPATDAVSDDFGLVVLRNGVVHSLAGIGPFLWVRSARPITVDELATAALAEFGAPGADAETLVRAAVEELVGARLMERV